ncbi:MAG TPA: hypothetical protein VFY71_11980 [Planctomycetota bacterium]|nr:hypothetical protein [Planctomycetota bacterium]
MSDLADEPHGENAARPPLEVVPAELRVTPQWVCFRLLPPRKPKGKPTKFPVDPQSGEPADTTDAATWGTFEQAVEFAQANSLAGVGFVFTGDDPYVGVDLDDCRDATTGLLADWARAIVDGLQSYTEVSFSGTGVHVLGRGTLPEGGRRKGRIEMYERDRYFVVTGRHVDGMPTTIEERSDELAKLHAATFAKTKPKKAKSQPPQRRAADLSDDELLAKARAADNGAKFDALYRGDTTGYPSRSEADLALCGMLAFWTGPEAARIDALFRRSGLVREKWDERHGEQTYGQLTIAKALEGKTEFYTPDGSDAADGSGGGREGFTATLVKWALAQGLQLFHDDKENGYAAAPVNGHIATMRLRDRRFRSWLNRGAFKELGRTATAQVLNDVCATLLGIAIHDAPEERVFVRIAEHDGAIFIDLGRPEWDAVEITASGWRVVPTPPVRFRRPAGFVALPLPIQGGTLAELRPFINCTDADWPLILAWAVSACRPRGPYPVLVITGPQGSAKSTIARLLRLLIDPNTALLRSQPGGDRDLIIAASNSWLQTCDNLSSITPAVSDALCRLSTGGGYATRTLYTDDDETLFDVQRPVTLTSIEEVVTRSDLLDRSLLVYCPEIPEENRRAEEELLAEFEAARPRLMGALWGAVATGLRNIQSVRVELLPRMADFGRWGVACEPAFGLVAGAFLAAYRGNQEGAVALALEANPVACAVRDLVYETGDTIRDTAAGLLGKLDLRRGSERPPRDWPQTPKAFSGLLRRGVPSLKTIGILVAFTREKDRKRKRWITLSLAPKNSVRTVRDRPDSAPTTPETPIPANGVGRTADAHTADAASEASAPEPAIPPDLEGARTQSDGSDADLGGLREPGAERAREIFADAVEVDAAAEGLQLDEEGGHDA